MQMMTQPDADARVAALMLRKLRTRDFGWREECAPPEHFITCPDVTVSGTESRGEMWFDTGVEATVITATLTCPHMEATEWEWAALGELPDILRELDK